MTIFKSTGSLSLTQKLSYGVGHVYNDLCASQWFTYFLLYFNMVLKFKGTLSGLVMLVGQIADAISTVIVGLEIDQNRSNYFSTCKFGRRKMLHLIGTFCIVGSFPFIFAECYGCEHSEDWAKAFYYSVLVIIFQFGWAAVQISHLSLIPYLSTSDQERTQLTAIRYAFTALSNIMVFVITWLALGLRNGNNKIAPEHKHSFQVVVCSITGIGLFFSFIFHLGVKEVQDNLPGTAVNHTNVNSISFWEWFKKPEFYSLCMLYVGTRLYVNLTQVYLPLYLQSTLSLPSTTVASLPLLLYVTGMVASFPLQPLHAWAGKRASYFIGILVGISACLWVWFDNSQFYKSFGLYGAVSLMGIASSVVLITSLAFTADLVVDYAGNTGFIYGVMSFMDKASNGVAVMLLEYLYSRQYV